MHPASNGESDHSPQKLDIEFVNELGKWKIPFTVIFTKADKENQKTVSANVKAFFNKLKETWQFLPNYFVTSAVKKTGRDKILEFIGEMNEEFKKLKIDN